MCYNCGCKRPNDAHGKGHAGVDEDGKAITDRTFTAAGRAFDMDEEAAKRNVQDLLAQKVEAQG